MRRWSWLLGLLVIVVLGAVWWASRNAIRMEPLDAQRFAQMRETEQVEWLIEQILARSNTNRASKVRELTPLPKVPPRQRGKPQGREVQIYSDCAVGISYHSSTVNKRPSGTLPPDGRAGTAGGLPR